MIRPLIATLALVAGTAALAPPEPRRFDLANFDAVELASSDAVRVVPGAAFSIVADGDPRAVAALDLDVRGGTLRVDRRPGRYTDRGATVTVAMPALRAATLSGSGSLTLAGLRATTVRFDLSGSGSIVAGGSARHVAIDLAGSGRIDTRRLTAERITVDLGGSGSIEAMATGTADVRAGGSGLVRIGGHPRCTVRRGGSAIVRCG